ncbi:MAG: DUF5615 family PIN-like protein [Lyngbya sp.]|nr:DUF5615 family PIN-like protein [Lyngbya sp.]
MARLYADEQFPRQVVELLRDLGHNVLTVQEAENTGLSDESVLAFAGSQERAVITLNRRDFIKLHKLQPNHAGIVVCKDDSDREGLATRIHQTISKFEILSNQLIRVSRLSS